MKFLEFFQSAGENSSRRLVYITSSLAIIIEFFRAMDQLISGGHAAEAVELFIYFMILVAISGGLVSLETIRGIIESVIKLKTSRIENGRGSNGAINQ